MSDNSNLENNQSIKSILTDADQAMQKENWPLAAKLYEDAYDRAQTWEINYALVRSLFLDNQFSKARKISYEFFDEYVRDEATFRLMVSIFLSNQSFIEARQFINLTTNDELRQELNNLVITAENDARGQIGQTLKTLARQFYHLPDYSLTEQRRRLIAANGLPLSEYLAGARFLLVDPFVKQIIHIAILENLQRLKIDEKIDFLWLDDAMYSVNPSHLASLFDYPVFNQMIDYIEEITTDKPHLKDQLNQVLYLQMGIAYPFLDRVVEDPKKWVDTLVAKMEGDEQNTDESLQQQQWRTIIEKLEEEVFSVDDE